MFGQIRQYYRYLIVLSYIDPGTGYVISGITAWLISILAGFFAIFSLFFKRIFRFLKKDKRISGGILLLIIILGLVIRGVTTMKKITKFNKRIVILGFDALSPSLIEPMMAEGKLPNFSHLKKIGSYKQILSTNPPQSPVAWSGFSTGKNPGKNGVYDFIVRDPKNYNLALSFSKIEKGRAKKVLKTKSLWHYASQVRVPLVILNLPVTFPPDKFYGRMLSGMGVPDILGTEGTFTFYTSEKLETGKDMGGKVFQVKKSPLMVMYLIGPRVATGRGKAENVRIPFKVQIKEDKEGIVIECQKNKFELAVGQWSDWKEVNFRLNFLKRTKGILKFYLIEIEPEFKLYISPINFDPREPLFPISYPRSYSKELVKALGLFHTQGMPFDTWAVNEGRISDKVFLEEAKKILQEERQRLDFEMSRLQKGILLAYFESPDIIQHMFWRFLDPQHPLYEKEAPEEFKKIIPEWYQAMDEILGNVLAKLQPQDIVLVLSDHGFGPFRRAVHVNSWLRKNGYLELKNPYADSGEELLLDIDWAKTRAYAIGFGAIYINQEDREGYGIVKPGKETEDLKNELAEKLENWRDEKYNQPVIKMVYKREEIFWGDYADQTPDLYIGFNIGYRASWQTAMGGVPKLLIEDNLKKWSGDHLFDPQLVPGVIFSNQKITKEKPCLYDITPTILKIIGWTKEKLKEENFDGEPLF